MFLGFKEEREDQYGGGQSVVELGSKRGVCFGIGRMGVQIFFFSQKEGGGEGVVRVEVRGLS